MTIQKVYLDASVIGGYFDEEFEFWTRKLIGEIRDGLRIAVVSDLVMKEIDLAPKKVRELLEEIPKELITSTEESENLAMKYIEAKALAAKHFTDAEHIALATVNNVDILTSWNFQHIVKLWRIQIFNGVNLMNGYKAVEIRSPREVINE